MLKFAAFCLAVTLGLMCVSTGAYSQDSFGSRQLAQMLDDRPEMNNVIDRDDAILKFVLEHFEKGDDGKRVYWLGVLEHEHDEACHLTSSGYYPAMIYIPKKNNDSPIDKWVKLVFEFHNIDNKPGFERLRKQALSQEITPEKFADEALRLEHAALGRTKEFFLKNGLKQASKDKDIAYYGITEADYTDFDVYLTKMNESSNPDDPRRWYIKWVNDSLKFKGMRLVK